MINMISETHPPVNARAGWVAGFFKLSKPIEAGRKKDARLIIADGVFDFIEKTLVFFRGDKIHLFAKVQQSFLLSVI